MAISSILFNCCLVCSSALRLSSATLSLNIASFSLDLSSSLVDELPVGLLMGKRAGGLVPGVETGGTVGNNESGRPNLGGGAGQQGHGKPVKAEMYLHIVQ